MNERTLKLYITDILEAIRRIDKFVENSEFEEFIKDDKTVNAVERNFEIIGEAARSIPEETKIKHRDVPWRNIISMRNILAHEYFGTDLEIMWATIKEDLPIIKLLMKHILKTLKD
jgi:hypothetical protein